MNCMDMLVPQNYSMIHILEGAWGERVGASGTQIQQLGLIWTQAHRHAQNPQTYSNESEY